MCFGCNFCRWTFPTSWSRGNSWPNWCWTMILPEQGLSVLSSLSFIMLNMLNYSSVSGDASRLYLNETVFEDVKQLYSKPTHSWLTSTLVLDFTLFLCITEVVSSHFSNFPLLFQTQMVAGNQVNNLRNKHSSTDGQGWPTQGGDGWGHEQSGALQGNQHEHRWLVSSYSFIMVLSSSQLSIPPIMYCQGYISAMSLCTDDQPLSI